MSETHILAPTGEAKSIQAKTYYLSYEMILDVFTRGTKLQLYFSEEILLTVSPEEAKRDWYGLRISGKIHAEDFAVDLKDMAFSIIAPHQKSDGEPFEDELWIVLWKELGTKVRLQGRTYHEDPWENY